MATKPGDSIEIGLGWRTPSTKAFHEPQPPAAVLFQTEQNGKELADTDFNVASVNFGVNHAITERVSVSVSVGVGSPMTQRMTVEIRLPIRF